MPPGRPKRSELNRILKEANVSGEYGAMRYAIADILHNSVDATAAVQQQVAFEVNKVYQGAYRAYQGRGGTGTFGEYMQMPGVQWQLSSQPLDLSLLASTPLYKGGTATFGQKYEGLTAIRNVEQANQWLASTMLPGVLNEAAQMEDEGRGAMDYVGAGVIGMMEAMPSYVPGKSNPSLFLARAAYQGIRQAARADRMTLSIDAAPNSFYEGEQFIGNPGMEPSPVLPADAKASLFSQMQNPRQWFGAYTPTDINPQSAAGMVGVQAGDTAANLGFIYSEDPAARQFTYDALDVLSSGGTLRLQMQRGEFQYSVPIQGGMPTRLMQPEAQEPFYERLARNMGESALPTNYYVDPAYGLAGPNGMAQDLSDLSHRMVNVSPRGLRGRGGRLMISDSQGLGMIANPTLSSTRQPGYIQAWITPDDVRSIGSQIASGEIDYTTPERQMLRSAMNSIPGMFRASSGVIPGEAASSIQMFDDYASSVERRYNPGGGGRSAGSSYDYLVPYKFKGGPGGGIASEPWFPAGMPSRPIAINDPNQSIEGLAAPDTTKPEIDEWRNVTESSPRSLIAQQNSAYALALSLIPDAPGYGSLGTQLGGMARRGFRGYRLNDLIPSGQIESNEFGMAVTGAGGSESLLERRRWMAGMQAQIAGRSPALAARARYVGFGAGKVVDGVNLDEQFAENVAAVAEQYDLSLSYDPKHPDAFGRQFEAIRRSDPQMAGVLSEVLGMPNEEAVYNNLKTLEGKLQIGVSDAQNSAVPARANVPPKVASRTGRRGAEELSMLLNGTGAIDPDTGRMVQTIPGMEDGNLPPIAARGGGGAAAARRAAARAAARANSGGPAPAGGSGGGGGRVPPTNNNNNNTIPPDDWDDGDPGDNEPDPFGPDWGDPQANRTPNAGPQPARGNWDTFNGAATNPRPITRAEAARLGPALATGMNTPSKVSTYRSALYGQGAVSYVMQNGRSVPVSYGIYDADSNQTASMQDIDRSMGWAQKAIAGSTLGYLPDDPADRAATIKTRVSQAIQKEADAFIKEMEKDGEVSPTRAKAAAEVNKSLATAFAKREQYMIIAAMNGDNVLGSDAAAHDQWLGSAKAIREFGEQYPAWKAKFAATGMTPEQLAAGDALTFVGDIDGTPTGISVGGGGSYNGGGRGGWGGGYGGGGAAGMFGGGRFGSLLYGAYLTKRMWSMTTQPFVQDAEKYAQAAQEYGNIAAMGGGYTPGLASGYTARAALAQERQGSAAYDVFGGFMEFGNMLGSSGPGGRLLTYGSAAAGIASTAAIGATMFLGPGGAAAPVLGGMTVGGLGLAAGGGILAAGLAMEGMNLLGLGQKMGLNGDVTPTNLFASGRANMIMIGAQAKAEKAAGLNEVLRMPFVFNRDARLTDEQLSAQLSDEDKAFLKARIADTAPERRIESLTATASSATRTAPDQVRGGIRELNRLFGSWVDGSYVNSIADAANASGLTWDQQISSGTQYADISGYMPGSLGYRQAFDQWTQISNQGPQAQAEASNAAQRYAQLGSQIQGSMPLSMAGIGTRVASRYGIQTQQQMSMLERMGNAAQAGGRSLNWTQWNTLAEYAASANPTVAGVIGAAGQAVAGLGGNGFGVEMSLMAGNIQPRFANAYASAMQGDLGAASFLSWQQGSAGSPMFRLFDQSGFSINDTNGEAAMTMASAWNTYGLQSASFVGANTRQSAQNLLGTQNSQIVDAYLKGGMQGLDALGRQQQYEGQMASIGVQGAGLALQANYLWGSGSWSNPAPGSSYAIQDQQIAQQYQSQMADFAAQQKQMQVQNRYAVSSEKMQYQRMQTTQGYNAWQMDFSRMQQLQQQQWTQADWQYQATTRELNYGWQAEDLNEAIRYSSGRERRDLIKQRDRAALSYNLEGEQVVTQQDRQKQLWAEEDERFKKQKQYSADLNRMDLETFNLQKKYREDNYKLETDNLSRRKKDYEKEYDLEAQARTLSRKYQSDQIDLQKASLGIQAQQITQQHNLNEAITKGNQAFDKMTGEISQIEKYDQVLDVMTGLRTLTGDMNQLDTEKAKSLSDAVNAFKSIDPAKLKALEYLLSQLNQ
jgi:hypothetical protein